MHRLPPGPRPLLPRQPVGIGQPPAQPRDVRCSGGLRPRPLPLGLRNLGAPVRAPPLNQWEPAEPAATANRAVRGRGLVTWRAGGAAAGTRGTRLASGLRGPAGLGERGIGARARPRRRRRVSAGVRPQVVPSLPSRLGPRPGSTARELGVPETLYVKLPARASPGPLPGARRLCRAAGCGGQVGNPRQALRPPGPRVPSRPPSRRATAGLPRPVARCA